MESELLTPEQINEEWLHLLRTEGERPASDYYKREHTRLIDARNKAERAAARPKILGECGHEVSHSGRGRPPKLCIDCRG